RSAGQRPAGPRCGHPFVGENQQVMSGEQMTWATVFRHPVILSVLTRGRSNVYFHASGPRRERATMDGGDGPTCYMIGGALARASGSWKASEWGAAPAPSAAGRSGARTPARGAPLALLTGVGLRLLEPWPLKIVFDRVLAARHYDGLSAVPFLDDFDPMALLAVAALGVVVITGLRALADYYYTV